MSRGRATTNQTFFAGEGLARAFGTDHAHYVKSIDDGLETFSSPEIKPSGSGDENGLEKKQKHGGRRRDCFSLLYFGNSQIYCWFSVSRHSK